MTDLHQAWSFYIEILGLPVLFEDTAQRIVIVVASGGTAGQHGKRNVFASSRVSDRDNLEQMVLGLMASAATKGWAASG